jgi:6-phosphogluconolactonase (cycloisomerase 2 family)
MLTFRRDRGSSFCVSLAALTLVLAASDQPRRPTLALLDVVRDGDPGVANLGSPRQVALSPDGSNAYVVAYQDNAVSVFVRDSGTGLLTFLEDHIDDTNDVDGLNWASDVEVSPDGKHVYVTGRSDDSLAWFHRNLAYGTLTYLGIVKDELAGVDGLDDATSLTLSPDGINVYATGEADNSVAVFTRNPVTGALIYEQVLVDGVGGVDGLEGAQQIAISPDGKHAYVTGAYDNALAVFSRSGVDGSLTSEEVHWDDYLGVDGLEGAFGVAVSPDGKHVYVNGYFDNSVAAFSRNPTTGSLTFLGLQPDETGSLHGIDGSAGLAFSADGATVYVTAYDDDALLVFARNAVSGRLTPVEARYDGKDGFDGLDGCFGIAVSPDGKYLYVTADSADSVATFLSSQMEVWRAELFGHLSPFASATGG